MAWNLTALFAQSTADQIVPLGTPPVDERGLAWYFILAILLAVTVLPFVLGDRLAKAFRMNDYGWKFGLILATLASGVVIVAMGWPPRYGIDLSGGVILVYEIDPEASRDMTDGEEARDEQSINVDELVSTIAERINPGGVKEIVVRPYGPKQVEIIVPELNAAEVAEIKRIITTTGHLKFRIAADPQEDELICVRADHPSQQKSRIVRDLSGEAKAEWVGVAEDRFLPGELAGFKTRVDERTKKTEVLMLILDFNVEGRHLKGASASVDGNMRPCINFAMTGRGSALFGALTGANMPDKQKDFYRKLGIVMDNRLLSAPRINDRITNRGQITGNFEQEEVNFLVAILKAGRLPAALRNDPISESQVSPMLGEDTIRKGKTAIAISIAAVLVFMLIYYRFSGFVACLALVTNLVLIMALMILFKAALSLPGLAGLVLTIGMSVDANVLIFERIREELNRGSALRMALRNGFAKATTTIVDANLTTLITAIVLYAIGTDQIRGFAVTLILGILMSMYTAIFCSRVVFDVVERRRWITKLNMMRMLGETHIDFIGKRRVAAAISVLLITVGLTTAVYRGSDIFDIDFNGGTSVQILLKKEMPIEDVRALVKDWMEDAWVTGFSIEGKKDRVYKIDTSITGFGDVGTIKITDRTGKTAVVDLSQAATRDDITRAINRADVNVEADRNPTLDGVLIVDRTKADQSNFIIANGDDLKTADRLNIAYDGPETSVDSGVLPGSVEIVERELIELFKSKNGDSLLEMHDMQFDPPKMLAMAEPPVEQPESPPAGEGDRETPPPSTTNGDASSESPPAKATEDGSDDTPPAKTTEEATEDGSGATPPAGESTEASPSADSTDASASGDAADASPSSDSTETPPSSESTESPPSSESTDAPTPETTDGARTDLPGDDVLAFAGNDLMLFAQAEPASDEASADADETPAESDDSPKEGDDAPADSGDAPADADDEPADEPATGEAEPPADGGSEPQPSDDPEMAADGETDPPPSEDAEPAAGDAPAAESSDADAEPATTSEPGAADADAAEAGTSDEPAPDAKASDSAGEPATTEEPPAVEPDTEPATEPKADDGEPADPMPPADTAGGAESPADPAAADPAAAGASAEAEPPATTAEPAGEGVAGDETASGAGPAGEQTERFLCETKLTFDEPINAESVISKINSVAEELEFSPPLVELDAKDWDGRNMSKGFTEWKIKISTDTDQTAVILGKIRDELASDPVWPSSNKIGSAVAGKMQNMAVAAMMISLVFIVGYIWFRFQKVVFGLAAVVALVHDVAITLGAIAVSAWLANYFGFLLIDNFKISLPVVAAFLTIIGYSLNDTIVVFDRIREVKGKSPDLTADMVNSSINQTLSRTLLTSITTLLVVLILYTLGGQGIHSFAFCLLIGVMVGTYSSIFVASPFLLWMSGATKSSVHGKAV